MKLMRMQNPSLLAWPGVGRLSDWQDEIERLFGVPLEALEATSPSATGWGPSLDVYEDEEQFVVKAELPGMDKNDIHVSFEEGALTLSGERKDDPKLKQTGEHLSERYFGRFERTVKLPTLVQGDKVTADYRDGILSITLPKAEEAKPKRISVSVE